MRRFALVVLAACSSDPTLTVKVVHPATASVSSTVVSVYDSKMFTCQDIEYGNVDATALQAALVATETLDATGVKGALVDLPRTDDKMIVARGYDGSGNLVTAGCADKGVISGADKVEVDTVVTAVVSIALADPTGTDLYGIATTLTDLSGHAIDGRQVWWRVYGPAGAMADARTGVAVNSLTDGVWEPPQPTCTKNGLANIHPVPPGLIGGFAVEVRAAWAVDAPKMFSSFTKIALSLSSVTVPTGTSEKYCARHVAGGVTHLTCLDDATGTLVGSDYTVTVAGGAASLAKGASTPVPPDAIALYDVANAMNRDVYAATATCAIAPLFGAGGGHIGSCTGADDIMVVPSCGSATAKLLFHVPGGAGNDAVRQIDLATGNASNLMLPFAGAENRVAFNAAGCITELDPTGNSPAVRQAIVLDFSHDSLLPQTRALYNCTPCSVLPLPIAQAAVGFTTGSESRMIVTLVDASGVVLSHDVLLPDSSGAADHLVERSREAAASVPLQLVAGNFDNDNGTDLLFDVVSRRGTSFEISYARMVGDQPLAALSPVQVGTAAGEVIVGDVTNDPYDDIVVLGSTVETVPKRGIAVVPTGVPPPMPTSAGNDKTCAP